MKLKPYPKYKDSGIQWIGEIPEGWEVRKIKHLCSKSAEYGLNEPSDNYIDDGIRFLRITDITEGGNLIENGVYLAENKTNKEYLLNTDDVLVARSGSIGTSLYFDKEKYGKCLFAGYLVRFVVNKTNSGRFLYYFTNSKSFYAQIELETIQTTIGNFNGQKYANMRIAISSLLEQTAIASFLDKKTAKIDALIEKDKKLIALLKEKRAALINHAVTKGLDPNVKLKDSGVEWIGKIPEGWEVRRLKHILNLKSGDSTKDLKEGEYNIYGANGIIGKCNKYKFYKKNILIGRVGSSGSVVEAKGKYWVSDNVLIVILNKNNDYQFIKYKLISLNISDLANKNAQPLITATQIKNIITQIPENLPEQTAIANFLDKATAKIDKTIQKIKEKINLLEEYKKSLIHYVVTGKIDVRGLPAWASRTQTGIEV